MERGGDGHFPNTSWTLIERLKDDREEVSRRALEDLCAQYHYPLYCYIRRRGLDHHDSEDALHDFLTKLLRLDSFKEAKAQKGRLRSFLATSLYRFLINWKRDKKHELRTIHLSIDIAQLEDRYQKENFADTDTPERIFDRKWSQALLNRVMELLKQRYSLKNKQALFGKLQPVLINGGSLKGEDAAALAASLNLSETALRVAMSRLLKLYRDLLEEEVLQTVDDHSDVKNEIASLIDVLGKN
jgi:DNA-directed RNA polymerase specialized sigma24 family protein